MSFPQAVSFKPHELPYSLSSGEHHACVFLSAGGWCVSNRIWWKAINCSRTLMRSLEVRFQPVVRGCVRGEGRKRVSPQCSSESQSGQRGAQSSDCPSEDSSRKRCNQAQSLLRSSPEKWDLGLSAAADWKCVRAEDTAAGGSRSATASSLKGRWELCTSVAATLYFWDTMLSLFASLTASVFLCSLTFLYPAVKRWGSSGEALSSPCLLFPWTISTMPVASLVTLGEMTLILIPDFFKLSNLEPAAHLMYFGCLKVDSIATLLKTELVNFLLILDPFPGFYVGEGFPHSSSYIS